MSTPILATKLYVPPPRADAVARTRLIERLNTGLPGKLTLISAPAGFGKTTLIATWVAACERPVAWLSLDESDSDPGRFVAYLLATLQQIVPGIGAGATGMIEPTQSASIELILTTLLNDLAGSDQAAVLVLDDYHAIESPTIDQALAFLLEHLPPWLHLVITTREDPQLPLARLRVRGQLMELRAADLRFTTTEAAAFLNQVMGLQLSVDDIAALDQRTEGWIAGLQLAALSMRGADDTSAFIRSFTGSHHFVLDYLLEEVLHRQSAPIQAFLLHTSILERLCGPLCDALLKDAGERMLEADRVTNADSTFSPQPASSILEQLDRANLFLIPLDGERRWYRYHHLFADLLRQRLQQTFPAGVTELHRRASAWYEASGLELEAFQHAAAANDTERAVRLIASTGMPLYYRGAATTVLHWLEALPPKERDARPELWVMYGSVLMFVGQISRVEATLQASEAALEHAAPGEGTDDLIGQIAAIRAQLAAPSYAIETIIEQSRKALAYLHPENLPARTAVTRTLGVAYQYQGDRTAAAQAYSEAIGLSEASGNTFVNVLATTGLGMLQESQNQLYEAESSYRRVLELVGDPPQPLACEAYIGLARLAYEWNDLERAEQYVRTGIELAQQIDGIDSPVSGEILLARLQLAQGHVAGASERLARAEQVAHRHNYDRQLPVIAAARVAIRLRQDASGGPAAALAAAYESPAIQARILLAQGDPSAALAILAPARRQAEERDWRDDRLRLMVLETIALKAGGETTQALQLLGEVLELSHRGAFVRLFLDEGRPMQELLERVEAGRLQAYAQRLQAAFAPQATAPTHAGIPQPLVEPLSEREREILQLVAQGLSNREICDRLVLALDTVKGHNRRIFDKLQVQRRTEAVARARELGLL
jgi:LuxR family maltose regulon positive regulatory protein